MARPGTVTPTWISNTLLFAAPLGILAAGQTLVMLTGGIDLSVASVATGSAYLMATNSSQRQPSRPAFGLAARLGGRTDQRRRRRGAAGAAAGDDARHRADDAGHDDRLQPEDAGQRAAGAADFIAASGQRQVFGGMSDRPLPVGADRAPGDLRAPPHGVRPAALCGRRQSRGLPTRRRAGLAGAAGRLRPVRPARGHRRPRAGRRHQRGRSRAWPTSTCCRRWRR